MLNNNDDLLLITVSLPLEPDTLKRLVGEFDGLAAGERKMRLGQTEAMVKFEQERIYSK